MKEPIPVESFVQRMETKNGRTRLYELYYCGWLDENGKLRLTACGGKARPVSGKIRSIAQALQRAA